MDGPVSGLNWVKSSLSFSNGNCVEVAAVPGQAATLVRDSKDPDGPKLCFTEFAWRAFVTDRKRA